MSPEEVWAHCVYYPTPDCQLGWHSDSEDGVSPHSVFSLTFLEDRVNGPRPFCVRLKSRVIENKKQKV